MPLGVNSTFDNHGEINLDSTIARDTRYITLSLNNVVWAMFQL